MTRHLIPMVLALWCACSVAGDEADDLASETPSETCRRAAGVICQQLIACYSPEERAAAMLPASEAECLSQMEVDLECATQRADNQCPAGESYDPDRAADCVVEYQAVTCEVVREGITDEDTPSCAQVCR